MALLVIALAGVIMAATARRSCLEAVAANTALEDLRRRWGALSLQRALADRCEEMILAAEAAGEIRIEGPVTRVEHRLKLAGMDWRLVVADEQAKANVNAIHLRQGDAGVRAALTQLLGADLAGSAVALRPTPATDPRRKQTRPYGSLGQVFDGDWAGGLLRPPDSRPAGIDRITCWGDGRINLRRACPEALRAATVGALDETQVGKLLAMREDIPGLSLSEALDRLELTRRQRAAAEAVLTGRSGCHSLWIVGRTSQRQWRRLVVVEASSQQGGSAGIEVLVW